MGQNEKKDRRTSALQMPAQKPRAATAAAPKMTREQLLVEAALAIQKLTGTRSEEAADRLLQQAANALVWPNLKQEDAFVSTLAVLAEMGSQNATETMLSVQMIAAHEAALLFLRRAVMRDETFEGAEANVLRATRLMRVFNEQLEAMQKLKGKTGQQKVTVEHVHVHEGGQAIVGAVSAPKGEGGGGQ